MVATRSGLNSCQEPIRRYSALREVCLKLSKIATIVRCASVGAVLFRTDRIFFSAYVTSLDAKQRQNYKRRLKLLNNSFKVQSDVVRDATRADEAFCSFQWLHDAQWKAQGRLGHFDDWPNARGFNVDLVSELSKLDRFRITRIYADEKPIAFQFSFVFGDCCYWRLPHEPRM